jgi:hypothetical protein
MMANSVANPLGNSTPGQILAYQGPYDAPQNPSLTQVTNAINVSPYVLYRLRSFPTTVYTLKPTDHLTRLMQVLLGTAGVGQYRKRIQEARFATIMDGADFYELTAFYANIFGINRLPNEMLSLNPYSNLGTKTQWSTVQAQDSQFKARIAQFARAINMGPSALGLQAVAESILQQPCTIVENWTQAQYTQRTYGQVDNLGSGSSTVTPLFVSTAAFATNTTGVQLTTNSSTSASATHEARSGLPATTLWCLIGFGINVATEDLSTEPGSTITSQKFGGYFNLSNKMIAPGTWTFTFKLKITGTTTSSIIRGFLFRIFSFKTGTYTFLGSINAPNTIINYSGSSFHTFVVKGKGGLFVFAATTHMYIDMWGLMSSSHTKLILPTGAANFRITTPGVRTSATYEQLGAYSYGQLQQGTAANANSNLRIFTITPYQAITLHAKYSLQSTLDVLKPADSIAIINTHGLQSYRVVTPSGAYADSSWWEMVESVIPVPEFQELYSLATSPDKNGFKEVLKPPGSSYQGEEIVYNGDIVGALAYALLPTGQIVPGTNVGGYTFADNVTLIYPATQGVMPRFTDLTARVVRDGVLNGAIFSKGTTLPLYVDGINLSKLASAVKNTSAGQFLGSLKPTQYFWSSLIRSIQTQTQDVLEVRLQGTRLVNTISFTLAHYPQKVRLQTWTINHSQWITRWSTTIYDSIPAIIPPSPPLLHVNPYHNGSNHWTHFTVSFPAGTTPRIRLVMTRNVAGAPPSWNNLPLSYPLGVQNLTIGYLINSEQDLPTTPIFTHDALGSQIEWTVRTEAPANAINGSTIPWQSSPQPTSTSVVNYYLNMRTTAGAPQLVTRFYIDPLYINTKINLYYSNTNPSTVDFFAQSTTLVPPVALTNGTLIPSTLGLTFPSADSAYITISNEKVQFQPSKAWWSGIVFQTHFPSSTTGTTAPPVLWSFGGLELFITNTNKRIVLLTTNNSNLVTTRQTITYATGTIISIITAYLPTATTQLAAGIHLWISTTRAPTLVHTHATTTATDIESQPSTLRFGKAGAPTPLNLTLNSFVLKQEEVTLAAIDTYVSNPQRYTTLHPYAKTDPTGNTTNSLLRFSPSFLSTTNISGFRGGPGAFWSLLEWTPIPLDFTAQKGFLYVPPTRACFWKFEFTNLSPQSINTFVPITQTVQTHQGLPNTVSQSATLPKINSSGSAPAGAALVGKYTSGQSLYADQSFANAIAPRTPLVTPPTAMQVAMDLSLQMRLAKQAWYWQYQTWHPSTVAPRFVTTGVHAYTTNTVQTQGKVGYFAGLNSIVAYADNPLTATDGLVYTVIFTDHTNITSNTWQLSHTCINTNTMLSGSLPVICTGNTFWSTTPVVGVQFATTQSTAVEIAFDDAFESGTLIASTQTRVIVTPTHSTKNKIIPAWTTTQVANKVGDATPSYNQGTQTVSVTRSASAPTITITPASTGRMVQPEVHPIFDLNTITTSDYAASLGEFGGLASAQSHPASTGFVWAAVRVTATTPLTGPLVIQVVDAGAAATTFTPTVVAAKSFTVGVNQTVEEFAGYPMGSAIPSGNLMYARVVQYGAANNTFDVDRLSLFDEGMIWQFSNNGGTTWYDAWNIRNTPNGALRFPVGGQYLKWRVIATRATVNVSALRIRPIYGHSIFGTYATPYAPPARTSTVTTLTPLPTPHPPVIP